MKISLTEDFRTIQELEKDPRAVMKQVRQTGRPVVVTVKGKPDMVIVDVRTYEKRLQHRTLAQLLAEGEADIAAGRVRPIEEFEAEFFRDKKVSR